MRLLWYALLVVTGLVTAGVQLDRDARRNAAVADWVPAPFRAFALERIALAESQAGLTDKALRDAAKLVVRRPIPAEHLSILAIAAAKGGEDKLAVDAVLLSAQRGWREQFVQNLIVQLAIQAGNWNVATERLAALWITDMGNPEVYRLTREVLQAPEARDAFGARMADYKDYWPEYFLIMSSNELEPAVYADTIRKAIAAGAQFDCNRLADRARRFVSQGRPDFGRELWSGPCVPNPGEDIGDFGFSPTQADGPTGPFDWSYLTDAGVTAELRKSDGAWVIDYRNSEPIMKAIARRYANLAAGSHTAELSSEQAIGTDSRALLLRVQCINAGGKIRLLLLEGRGRIPFEVPGEACASQLFTILASRGKGKGVRFSVD